jgi:bifunctional DNA-binding transcriptional regulator/antitoxin component of YhaV-PrlF toxin-antitoxin module
MELARVDPDGRLVVPRSVLAETGIGPDDVVTMEVTRRGLLIRSKRSDTPITDRIAAMSLPVAEWEQMEREIEAGRLA